jgi:DNA-binding response OmpR family regulator
MESVTRLLVVEDELIFAMNLRKELQREGYRVDDIINRGEAAVPLIKKGQFDCILMDIRLGGALNGVETAQEIRKFSSIPILFITGYMSDSNTEQVKTITNSSLVNKPVPPEEVILAIRELLEV